MELSGRGLKLSAGRWNSQVEVGSGPQDNGTVMKRCFVVPRMMELSGRSVLCSQG